MKKTFLIIFSCVLSVVLLCVALAACDDDDPNPSEEPIIGTWLCEDTENGAVYYVEISAKERDDNHLNWTMFGAFIYEKNPHNNEWREYGTIDLGINPKISGRYSLQSQFEGSLNALYQVDISGDSTFEVKGDQFAVSDVKYEFERTELTLSQFKEQYWDRFIFDQ